MIFVKVICYVNVENHFLTFTKHIIFTRIILGTPLIKSFMSFRSFSSKGMSMYNKANKATLSELNKQHEIVKLLSTSLNRAHAKAEDVSKKLGLNLKSDTLVDGRYTHKEYVDAHLELMMFLLKAELITEFFGINTRTG